MPIHVLDDNTINQIAAGEVVDRPSSIVKELVENAIDAKATIITVEIANGGIDLIRVTDNGVGIEQQEVRLAFYAHATSKIQDAKDLATIVSLGFRGEALSSICAVSQVELITKTKDSLMATRYEIEGAVERSFEQVGAPDGTTFLVRNLFFNTPARRKFLKSANTEAGYISALMEHLAMSHPEISFRYIQNKITRMQTIGNGQLKDVIYAIYGKEITNNLISIEEEIEGVRLVGFLAKPAACKGNRTYENYYINDRYVKNGLVAKAIEDAYAPFIMQHKYPFCALKVYVNPENVDVNVHPSKMEIRFQNQENIYKNIKDMVTKALTRRELVPEVRLSENPKTLAATTLSQKTPQQPTRETPQQPTQEVVKKVTQIPQSPSEIVGRTEPTAPTKVMTQVQETPASAPEAPASAPEAPASAPETPAKALGVPARAPEAFEHKRMISYEQILKEETDKIHAQQMTLFEKEDLLKPEHEPDIQIVGQVFDTYWILEYEHSMYIVDQHAAHEKVKFERFMRAYENRQIATQQLLPPVILEFTMQEATIYEENASYFAEFGYEIENFGENSYSLRGIPADFGESDPKELFMEIMDSLCEHNVKATPELVKDRIATMSCKAAVKGNNRLSVTEARTLLKELMGLENPYNCPHGRPTMITMSQYELEKKFKRIV